MNNSLTQPEATLKDICSLFFSGKPLALDSEARERIIHCREYLDKKIAASSDPVYGINTGFGSLYDQHISKENLGQLQENLVKSHACGAGDEVPQEIVRLMILLKIRSLCYGNSGVQLAIVERLIEFYNEGVTPVVFEMGSLGASGDLAPLAHVALPIIGLGSVYYKGEKITAQAYYQKTGKSPLVFQAKEGLALLNGTQMMGAYGVWCLYHGYRILKAANIISTLSLDVFDGRKEPFQPEVHKIRPQKGQSAVAAQILALLEGSKMITAPKTHVQDPYSFRCVPQVHGASMDALDFVKETFTAEINSVTDNPNVFPDEDLIISAGNFHGQPLALGLDFLAIALSELGSISERRTYLLISGARNLPRYLVANPGINSGLMIPQFTAAAMASQNKQLSVPASTDSIPSSNGQEDHVSMGANAALKARRVVLNLYSILAIELLTASQALEFRRPLRSSKALEEMAGNFKALVPFMEEDRVLHDDIRKAEEFVKTESTFEAFK